MQAKVIIIKRLFIFYSFLIWSGKDTEISFTKSTVWFVFQEWASILSKECLFFIQKVFPPTKIHPCFQLSQMHYAFYKSSRSKSTRLLLHFGEVIGFDEVLDELFCFGNGESEEGDGVDPVFLGDGVVGLVFLGEAADLVKLLF